VNNLAFFLHSSPPSKLRSNPPELPNDSSRVWHSGTGNSRARCVILGIRRRWDELFRLLGFRKTYASRMKLGMIGSPETSVWNHLTRLNNPEGGRINLRAYSYTSIALRLSHVRLRTIPLATEPVCGVNSHNGHSPKSTVKSTSYFTNITQGCLVSFGLATSPDKHVNYDLNHAVLTDTGQK
jgi:hypothetical protein